MNSIGDGNNTPLGIDENNSLRIILSSSMDCIVLFLLVMANITL